MNKIILKQHQRTCVSLAVQSQLGTFCYPTGTGKTIAEAHIIVEHIKAGDLGVYVVLAPRIMLANQLFSELWNILRLDCGISPLFFSLHSGKSPKIAAMTKRLRLVEKFDDQDDDQDAAQNAAEIYKWAKSYGLTDKELAENFESSTSSEALRDAAKRAKLQNRPLIIVSTYHSSERLTTAFEQTEKQEGTKISVLIADEGHNAVSIGFTHVHDIAANKRFYFTATLKNTDGGENGLGMQNPEKFGPILDALSPAEAVIRGLIVRPRVHYIEIADVTSETETDADFKAIEAGFLGHAKAVGGIGAKLLVACRGTLNIKNVVEHSAFFKRLRTIRPNLNVFDISSLYGSRINGIAVERADFLTRLQELQDKDEAIILHYDILSEGIDVPGITGVMPLRALGISKFLQTLGRATRLHKTDRIRLANEETAAVEAAKLDWFVKPCAWLVLPCYGSFGQEIKSSAETYVRQLRTFGWVPGENDLLTEAGGEIEPVEIGSVYGKEGKKLPEMAEAMGEVFQRYEDRKAMEEAYAIARTKSSAELMEIL